MTISILALAFCQGCNEDSSHQQGQQRQVQGQIRIVEVPEDPANLMGTYVIGDRVVAVQADHFVFLVTEKEAFSLTFDNDCVIEGIPQTQRGDGYPVTIGGRQILLHSDGGYLVSARLEPTGLQLSTRPVTGLRVFKLACTEAGEGDSYFQVGYRDELDRVFVADGGFAIFVDGNSRQLSGTIHTDTPAPWARDPKVPLPVVAPLDGTLLSIRVQSGDNVERDDELLRVDSPNIEVRLEELEATYREALLKVNRAQCEDNVSEAQLYQAEAKSIAARIEFLKAQIKNATVRSPVRGLVQSGDTKLAVGMPVRSGQVLFFIYPRP